MLSVQIGALQTGLGIDSDIHTEVNVVPLAQLEMVGIIGSSYMFQGVLQHRQLLPVGTKFPRKTKTIPIFTLGIFWNMILIFSAL